MAFGNRELIFFGAIAFLILSYKGGTVLADMSVQNDDGFYKWDALFKRYGKQYGVPWRWIKAIAWNESSLGTARSVALGLREPSNIEGSKSFDGKSWGLMQTTLATAREIQPNVTEIDLNNPETSIRIGTAILARLIKRFGIDDRESVVRAYNGGPGFMKTVQGRTITPVYYSRFVDHIEQILERQPGNELEF